MKRVFDIFCSFFGLLVLSPLLLIVALLVVTTSRGGVFYRQVRVGKDFRNFKILKFRSMRPDSDKKGLLTVGSKDNRVTKVGYFIRKYKIDELPQLINVFVGDMSFVGPRPEVPKYVEMYNEEQRKVLSVRPGITDYASIEYRNENDILAKSDNPEQTYIDEVMPAKLKLNLRYISEMSLKTDLKIIFGTIFKIFD
ncbi:MAG: sugar transferase [Bacteroidales bacterium]|nr:sugar transferase [Bacteroidales bacterium]